MMIGIIIGFIILAFIFYNTFKRFDAKGDDERAWKFFRYAYYAVAGAAITFLFLTQF